MIFLFFWDDQGARTLVSYKENAHIRYPCNFKMTVHVKPGLLQGCLCSVVSLQLPWAASPSNVTAGSFWAGFLCALLASPGAQLLSLLFRLSKVPAPATWPCSPGWALIAGTPTRTIALLPQEASGPPRAEPYLPPQGALEDAAQGKFACSL